VHEIVSYWDRACPGGPSYSYETPYIVTQLRRGYRQASVVIGLVIMPKFER
jgi:hypothetical protein